MAHEQQPHTACPEKKTDIPVTLRDNSPANDEYLSEMVMNDPEKRRVWGKVHLVVGYDPAKNGHPWPRGCNNACMTCWYGADFLKNRPAYVSDIRTSQALHMHSSLKEMMAEATQKAEAVFGYVDPKERVVRVSGDVLGDVSMADPDSCATITRVIRESFPEGVEIQIDTTANQKIYSPQEWKDSGADTIVVSVNAVDCEASYMAFHGVQKGRMAIMEQNVKNIIEAGLDVVFSYVWVDHPKNSPQVIEHIPDFWKKAQSDQAREEFQKKFGQTRIPERIWRVQMPPDPVQRAEVIAGWKQRAKWHESLLAK